MFIFSRDLVEKNLYVKSCIEKSDASQLEKRKRQKSGKRVKGKVGRVHRIPDITYGGTISSFVAFK